MGQLMYTTSMSLDGYVADADGDFGWGAPDAEIFDMHVDRMAEISAEVLGRKTYDLMRYWESPPEDGSWTAAEHEFARRWQTIEKVVVSTTMSPDDLSSDRSRLVRELDTAELRQLTESAPGSVEIFGPTTAATAIRAGMVSGFRLFVVPVIVGGGLRALPADAALDLRLIEQRTFANGTVYLHYAPR